MLILPLMGSLETERSAPSREMVLHLSCYLNLQLREQNRLLLAAGYALLFPEPFYRRG
jgi:hypothetical protein